ncbi:sialic acid-binding Ig-like lectin 6 [Fundulus heteroclitus]|uniref:sialic acid-binding Ig-like lectin 6 n=1 Tax=Fundulus heteroclitus TaxID=8078 RepID=UPI00165C1D5F|nr:sialic acid-binding Ig-like lectin 6 [Fundulus heteroclitus]
MGLLVCWSESSWICYIMATISFLLTFGFVSGALEEAPCSKNPSLFITTPRKLEALGGSCLQIPCTFNQSKKLDFKQNIFGIWIKKDSRFEQNTENVIFNSSGSIKKYSLEITGNLKMKNCTTLFDNLTTQHTEKYFFRIENGQFKATASCSALQVTVTDSPWRPSINIPADLKEHQSVTISCSALTPCPHSPPELTWNLQQDSHRQTEKNTEGTFTTKTQETITLSDTHDGYNIRCSATYPVNGGNKTAETEVTLSVSYAPRDTSASISPSGLVSAGSWVELNCSSRAKPPASFTWFKNSKHGAINVSVGQVYSLQMTNLADIESHYCVATNLLGSEKSTWSHLKSQGMDAVTLWGAVVGGFLGISVVICVVFILWRLKSKQPTLHQTQSSSPQEPASTLENQDIHYGDIDFGRMRASFKTVQDEGDLVDCVYSQVKVGKDENRPKEADNYIYAQVKKKPVNPHSTY